MTGIPAWTNYYESWTSAQGLASKVSAFVIGSAIVNQINFGKQENMLLQIVNIIIIILACWIIFEGMLRFINIIKKGK